MEYRPIHACREIKGFGGLDRDDDNIIRAGGKDFLSDGVAIAQFVGGSRDSGSDIKGAMGRNKLGSIEILKFQPAGGLVAVGAFRRAAFVGKMLLEILVSPLVVARCL